MAEQTEKPKGRPPIKEAETLVRIFGYDMPGSRKVIVGLTKIKGVSWAISNFVCLNLKIPSDKTVGDLNKDEIEKIGSFLKELSAPDHLKNRRADPETGETTHIYGTDLDLKKEFDIKRLKKIKSYRGLRHSLKLPSRGQRTRGNFRGKGKAVGVKRKK
tara:strand:- start:310 stop:786 length:477 start_codon:yes stop_codon:yes gene_type:complete